MKEKFKEKEIYKKDRKRKMSAYLTVEARPKEGKRPEKRAGTNERKRRI